MKIIALIPARAGSQRVKLKNIRSLMGHPLLAYTIAGANASGIFDKVLVSTDSEEIAQIARYYGAEVPFLRPAEYATTTSPDIEWLDYTFTNLEQLYDAFAILRPTSPFRQVATIRRAYSEFITHKQIDSIRAVELCKQHPGKMWRVENDLLQPYVAQAHLEVAYHARQYQDLEKVYIQNSALEMAWTRVVKETYSREGNVIAPFITEGLEGFAIDYEEDWLLAELLCKQQGAELPQVNQESYADKATMEV